MSLQKLATAVQNTNDAFAENGQYKAVHIDCQLNIIQFIDLEGSAQISTYNIADPLTFMANYTSAYEEDGGDDEYGSMDEWTVQESVIKLCQ